MHRIISVLDSVYGLIESGDITFKHLTIINDAKLHFEEAFELIEKVCMLYWLLLYLSY